jgi:hypothetical protein
MVFVANYWMSSSPRTVTIFTNCEEVELFVNGVSKGVQRPSVYTSLPHPVVQFANVTYQAGELKAVGRIGGSAVATHIRKMPGPAVKLVLTPDANELVVGGDMTRVVVTVVDTAGQIVPRASNSVTLTATGAGICLGESPIALEDGKTAFFVQTKDGQTGTIACSATGNGLTAGSAAIAVVSSQTPVRLQNPAAARVPGRAVASIRSIAMGGSLALPASLTGAEYRFAVYSMSGRLIHQGTASDFSGKKGATERAGGIFIVRVAPTR